MHVCQTDDTHTEQGNSEAAAVEPPHSLGDLFDGALFIVFAEIVFVGIGAVVCQDELRKSGGGKDVGHDEGEVHGCPGGGGDPVAADGVDVDAVGVDFEVDPRGVE